MNRLLPAWWVLPSAMLSALFWFALGSAVVAQEHMNPPERYMPCAEQLVASGNITFLPLPASMLHSVCDTNDAWACVFEDLNYVVIDAEAPAWMVPLIQLHEAAHFCGWPARHPGGTWVSR